MNVSKSSDPERLDNICVANVSAQVKVNQSRYRPEVAQRVPGSKGKAVPLQA